MCLSLFFQNIRHIRKFMFKSSTEKLVHAFITSTIDYCTVTIFFIDYRTCNLISKLQRVQYACARLVWSLPKFCHFSPLLQDLHWLPVKKLIDFKIILITFKILHNTAPPYLNFLSYFIQIPFRVIIFAVLLTILFFKSLPLIRSIKSSGD